METAAIFDWRRDMLRSDADSPRNSLARACYMLMPTELDAMLAGDTAANSFATVKDPRQLTSHLNNPEAGQSLDLTLLQAREIVGAKYSQSIPKSANAFEL